MIGTGWLRDTDRELFALAVPALGALIAEPLYVLADTAVIGHIGTNELGGLALASQVIGTVLSVSLFLAYGTTSAVSRLLGAGKEREAAHQAVQGLWIAGAIAVVFSVVCAVFAGPLLRLLQAEPEVEKFGTQYLQISVLGFPAMLLVMAGVGYLRGLKDTRRPLYVAIVTAVGNLLLELFLVFQLGFGVRASALSTVIFQWVGAALYVSWITSAARERGVVMRPDPSTLRQLGRAGIDLFIRTAALRASLIIAAGFAAAAGVIDLGAHEIAFQLYAVTALALDAIAIAGQAMVGTHLGASNTAAAKQVGMRLTAWGVGLGVVAGLALLAIRPWIPGLFTNDPALVDKTLPLLFLLALMQPLAGAAFTLDGILIGAGDMRFLAWAMVGATLCFGLFVWIVTIFDGGVLALWGALIGFMAIRAISLGYRLRSGAWLVTGAQR